MNSSTNVFTCPDIPLYPACPSCDCSNSRCEAVDIIQSSAVAFAPLLLAVIALIGTTIGTVYYKGQNTKNTEILKQYGIMPQKKGNAMKVYIDQPCNGGGPNGLIMMERGGGLRSSANNNTIVEHGGLGGRGAGLEIDRNPHVVNQPPSIYDSFPLQPKKFHSSAFAPPASSSAPHPVIPF